jgi:hypothetical protein
VFCSSSQSSMPIQFPQIDGGRSWGGAAGGKKTQYIAKESIQPMCLD